MKISRVYALLILACISMVFAERGDGLTGSVVCAPNASTVYVDPKATAWLPSLKGELEKQVRTLTAAYRLVGPCPSDSKTELKLAVTVYATDQISNGTRAYTVAVELYNDYVSMYPWYDYSIGISTLTVTDNKTPILQLSRGLIDAMGAAYNSANR